VTDADPIALFRDALARAEQSEPDVPTACVLATADARGRPSARVVLLRGVDERGFCFYTSYESRKARELAENPRAALCFHWKSLREQVRVEGTIERVSAAESDAYFASRPQPSQLAAIASQQSAPLPGRDVLERRYQQLRAEHGEALPPRPDGWGGYRLLPERIEFWHHGDHRLHHRVLYERHGDGWRSGLLYP
jgi:pyridoxamine 5'-phosphate oxidase